MEFLKGVVLGTRVPNSADDVIKAGLEAFDAEAKRVIAVVLDSDAFESGLGTVPLFYGYKDGEEFHLDLEQPFDEMWDQLMGDPDVAKCLESEGVFHLDILYSKNHCIPAGTDLPELVASLYGAIVNGEIDQAVALKDQMDESIRSSFFEACDFVFSKSVI